MNTTLYTHQKSRLVHSGHCTTPWGWAILEYQGNWIFRLEFLGGKRYPANPNLIADPQCQKTVEHLFKNPTEFVLNPQGTSFQQSVWQALQAIPYGSLRTYQEIAQSIGKPKSVRAVANAIGANPICIFIPCHRVVRSDGEIGGYSSGNGASLKRELLLSEGINLPNEDPSYE